MQKIDVIGMSSLRTKTHRWKFGVLISAITYCTSTSAQLPPAFKLHGSFQGVGLTLKTLMADGPELGTSRIYASHIYTGSTLDIVATDPLTGQTDIFTSPLASESGAWGMVADAYGRIYIGTLPNAHIMRLDWRQKKLVDIGVPSPTERYIWDLTLGNDKKLYGGTYPNAKLIRFDPTTGKSEDLGRMSNSESYARSVAADKKGFVYIGIGTSKADLVAYEIASGLHRSILPSGDPIKEGIQVVRGEDGYVYANLRGKWQTLNGWEIIPSRRPMIQPLQSKDKKTIFYDGSKIVLHGTDGETVEHLTNYQGKAQSIFRIGLGPDGKIYGSTMMPAHFFSADPNGVGLEKIAVAGAGEYYSFLAWKDRLLGAAYVGLSPVMSFVPGQAWNPGETKNNNPWNIHFSGENIGWRPMSMIAGPGEKVYIGAVPGYGLLGGPLCVFDPKTGRIDIYPSLIKDQSIYALATLPNGMIVGGTTIAGGSGSYPTQTEAKIFLWDTQKREKTFDVVPVPAESTIDALAVGKNGLVYGFAGKTMFVFDPIARVIIKRSAIPTNLGKVIYNAVAPGPKGTLYGLTNEGIFSVDESRHSVEQSAIYPGGITGGFAIRDRDIFFTQGAKLISYQLPNI